MLLLSRGTVSRIVSVEGYAYANIAAVQYEVAACNFAYFTANLIGNSYTDLPASYSTYEPCGKKTCYFFC